MKTPRLTIELVPRTCWFANVRSQVSVEDWTHLKQLTSRAAGRRCEVCGGRGPQWPVECHEVWVYDDEHHVQTLQRLIALCPACHEVKHLGLADTRGRGIEALRHLATVNGWSVNDAWLYAETVFEQWAQRSTHEWTLDLSYLDQFDICASGQDGKAPACKVGNPEFDSPLALHSRASAA